MGPTTSAVDLPRARVDVELGPRRHRRITGPAGLALFVCLFLPAVKGCNEPVYPFEMPMLWHPYLFGLVLAVGSAMVTRRALRYQVVALRILAWLTIVGAIIMAAFAAPVAVAQLLVGAGLLGAIGRTGCSERRVAITAILVGGLSLLWFGLWAATPDALVGVYVSAVASVGLLAGGLVWLGETS